MELDTRRRSLRGSVLEGWKTAFKITNRTQWENFVLRNNIFRGVRGAFYDFSPPTRTLPVSADGDCLFAAQKGNLVTFGGKNHADLEQFRKASQEPRGIQADPQLVDPDNADPRKADFRLKPSSPCVDKAIPIPNINDEYTGEGPDIGAFELPRAGK